jgi:hypothetical protein
MFGGKSVAKNILDLEYSKKGMGGGGGRQGISNKSARVSRFYVRNMVVIQVFGKKTSISPREWEGKTKGEYYGIQNNGIWKINKYFVGWRG